MLDLKKKLFHREVFVIFSYFLSNLGNVIQGVHTTT